MHHTATVRATGFAGTGISGQGFGLEVDGGGRFPIGDELGGLDDGCAVHALGSYAWRSGWEAGFGAGISFHDPAADVDGDISQDGALVGGQGEAEYWLTDEVGLLGTLGVEYLSFSANDGLPQRSGWWLRPQVGLELPY